MNYPPLYPINEETAHIQQHCKLHLHVGKANLAVSAEALPVQAEVILPPEGECLIFLRGQSQLLPNVGGIGSNLTVFGESSDGPFRLCCPQFGVKTTSKATSNSGWAVAFPINEGITITYGHSRPTSTINATINNFDFAKSNISLDQPGKTNFKKIPILRVDASGRIIDFVRRENREQLRKLVDAGILRSSAFTTFSFAAWEGATDEDLTAFTLDVASICTYAVGQHTGVPMLSFLDSEGLVIKRVLQSPMESKFRRGGILNSSNIPDGLTRLFQQCFKEHVRMRRAHLPWRKLGSYCASVEDSPYLEQKYATLMMALEFFIKNCILETGRFSQEKVKDLDLKALIGIARRELRWDIPKHYTTRDLYRLLRNAVMHGGELPIRDSSEFRWTFDKWKLFLYRRVLIRLGYNGPVSSPQNGWASLSAVNDFSEEHNTFA